MKPAPIPSDKQNKSFFLPRISPEGENFEPIRVTVKNPKGKLVAEMRKLDVEAVKLQGERSMLASEISNVEARINAAPLTKADELNTPRTITDTTGTRENPEYFEFMNIPSRTRIEFQAKLEKLYEKFHAIDAKIDEAIDDRLSQIVNVCKGDDDISIDDIDFEEADRDLKLEICDFFAKWSNNNLEKSTS